MTTIKQDSSWRADSFHFDEKWNFSFHSIICGSFGRLRERGYSPCLSADPLLASSEQLCSLDCTSRDMFSLLSLHMLKFKTSYSSGAALPYGVWGLSPPELYVHFRDWPWWWPCELQAGHHDHPVLLDSSPKWGNLQQLESIRAVTATA